MSGQSRAYRTRQAAIAAASPAPRIAPGHASAAHTVRVVANLALAGMTNQEIGKVLGVSGETFDTWAVEDTRIRRALASGREEADGEVARSLYRSAVGAKVKESKVVQVGGELQVVDVVREFPPNVPAATLWLANRQREKWKDAKLAQSGDAFDLAAAIGRSLAQGMTQALDGRTDVRPSLDAVFHDATDKESDGSKS